MVGMGLKEDRSSFEADCSKQTKHHGRGRGACNLAQYTCQQPGWLLHMVRRCCFGRAPPTDDWLVMVTKLSGN